MFQAFQANVTAYTVSLISEKLGNRIYGCDTSHSTSCIFGSPGTVTISNSAGVDNINFKSWADTSKHIY